ncbi:MAG: hypothetical protein HKN45_02330 [Flavobacteriales bacterium]|nr:hypothetical protein [Flavobacteriales bacterium]
MLKFFRTIRKNLLASSKTGKYFQYAIGEIILVVIGILLALQINNWNNERVERATMRNYYERMYTEVEEEIKVIERFIGHEERLIAMNTRSMKIIDSQNRDSIPALRETLGALATAWAVEVQFPVVEEFIDQGYISKIESDSLKWALKQYSYSMNMMEVMDKYITKQYEDRIEPYINENINYSEVALKRYRDRFIEGGPPTEFEYLFNDLEFWNLLTFKSEGLAGDIKLNRRIVERLDKLNRQIEKELDKES